MPAQLSSGMRKTSPVSSPSPAPAHTPRRYTAAPSSATPTGAAHHRSYGGNDTISTGPATSAAATDAHHGGAVGCLTARAAGLLSPGGVPASSRPDPDPPLSLPSWPSWLAGDPRSPRSVTDPLRPNPMSRDIRRGAMSTMSSIVPY